MKSNAVSQAAVRVRFLILALALSLVAMGAFASGAVAAAPGQGGQIHACYKVRGKAKGSMRVVSGKRCKKGERKLAWSVAGPQGASGPLGAKGAPGAQGQPGANGANGAAGSSGAGVVALESKIASLTLEVANLEGILQGVTNNGLLGAVKAVPAVDSLCTQATGLTTQANSLGTALSGASLGGVIPLGLNLNVLGVPSALPAYVCP